MVMTDPSSRRDSASRGQTRGRGGAARGRGQSSASRPNPPASITDCLGAVIQDISLEGVDHFPHADVENIIAVSSYDWLGQDKPTIGVPGMSPLTEFTFLLHISGICYLIYSMLV